MATWFVRQDTSHSGTRNGQSYASAWGGWSEIIWGASGVKAGDTLYVCGAHTYSEVIRPGASGNVSNRITIRGDHATEAGSITFAAGAYYFNIDRSYVTLQSLTIVAGTNRGVGVTGVPNTGFWLKNCTLRGTDSSLQLVDLMSGSGWGYADVIIDGNTFTGSGTGAILWNPSSGVLVTLSNIQISNNAFNAIGKSNGYRGVITLVAVKSQVAAGTKMNDIKIFGNAITDCYGVAIEAFIDDLDRSAGIKVYENIILNTQKIGLLGGGIVLGSFALSATPGFGTNDIYGNWGEGLHGLTGLANIMYGTYRVFNNYASNLTTADVDACGILFDHFCYDSVAFGNEIRDLHGNGNPDNSIRPSGSGILVLDATNCTAYGNLVVNCVTGVSFGNKLGGQSSNIFNNTFLNCSYAGAFMMSTADNTTNVVRNNIFTGTSSAVPAARVNTVAWTGESYNCFHGFGAPVAHTLAASTVTVDPQLDSASRPMLGSPVIAAGTYLGGMDFYGKEMPAQPPIGAISYYPARALVNRPVKSRAISA